MKHLYKSLITLLLFAANTCVYAGQDMKTKDTIVIVTNNSDDSCISHLVLNKGGCKRYIDKHLLRRRERY